MSRENIECAVMFADVAGSTSIYDRYGNDVAKAAIGGCVELMSEITRQFNGIVIKTIGDEVMSRFPSASQAVKAACAIQEAVNTPVGEHQILMQVRVGLHYGEAILENADVFGDAVNVAARMAGIAKARQIITTKDTCEQLSEDLADKARKFDITNVKGKAEQITIYDIIWDEEDDVTRMATVTNVSGTEDDSVTFIHKGQTFTATRSDVPLSIGRGSACDYTVEAPLASRSHARLEYNRGKFVLVDQSTNGTYVQLADGKEVYLRREELPLSSRGLISLGEKVTDGNPALIHFMVG